MHDKGEDGPSTGTILEDISHYQTLVVLLQHLIAHARPNKEFLESSNQNQLLYLPMFQAYLFL